LLRQCVRETGGGSENGDRSKQRQKATAHAFSPPVRSRAVPREATNVQNDQQVVRGNMPLKTATKTAVGREGCCAEAASERGAAVQERAAEWQRQQAGRNTRQQINTTGWEYIVQHSQARSVPTKNP